jgi:hypothetical protein
VQIGSGRTKRSVNLTACNNYVETDAATLLTTDPGKVDCLRCIAAVERASGELTDEVLAGRARPQARQRALKRLAEAHPDEFDTLLADELPGCIEELRQREISYRAYLEAHPI